MLFKISMLRPIIIWGLATLFYLYELMLLVSPSVMVDDLSIAFNANAEQLGSLAAFYYYAYALMQIPVGLLVDKFGSRKLLTLAALFCALGSYIFGAATTLEIAHVGRFVMGMGGSFAVVGCLKLASTWFPINRFALLTGIMVAIGMMGGVFGQAPVAKCVLAIGWRNTTFLGAGIGLILSGLIWLVVADKPKLSSMPHKKNSQLPFWHGLLQVMKMPQVWVASLYAGLMFVPTTSFGQLWGVPYFIERFEVPKDKAAWMVSMIFFGWAFGGPFYGWISDKLNRRKPPMMIAALGTFVMMSLILYINLSVWQMEVSMFLLGAFSSGFILAFSVVREINLPILTGTAIGFINTLNNASGAVAQPIVGRLLDILGNNRSVNGEVEYSLTMYNEALIFLPICIILALVMVCFIQETYCRSKENN